MSEIHPIFPRRVEPAARAHLIQRVRDRAQQEDEERQPTEEEPEEKDADDGLEHVDVRA